ncbi:alpha/beta hydrolase [Mycobacterium sp.]|uniref:alpha/beta hydrolase n=1 Tax=Mycobacterium sp. TaxID=1785 RepID=UPI002DAF9FD3|nr:alpha/beta hydrolase [Mycobacterium sp.]
MTEQRLPRHGSGIPASKVVPNHWLLQIVEKAGTAAVNRLPLRLRPPLLRATRQAHPSRKVASGIPVTEQTIDGVRITWLAQQRGCDALVYLHGGAFLAGPVALHWKLLAKIHHQTGLAAGMLLYRRPPQNPHPAALNDTLTAIRALYANGQLTEGHWVLAGDSAGGTIALSATQHLRDSGGPLPAGLMLTAPMVDMELAHPDTVAATEAAGLTRDDKFWWAFKLYADGLPFNDPTLSPINASVAGLPPVHLNVGTKDFFVHDIRRFHAILQANNVPVTYIEQERAEHVYALRTHTPQAQWTVNDQIHWLQGILNPLAKPPTH